MSTPKILTLLTEAVRENAKQATEVDAAYDLIQSISGNKPNPGADTPAMRNRRKYGDVNLRNFDEPLPFRYSARFPGKVEGSDLSPAIFRGPATKSHTLFSRYLKREKLFRYRRANHRQPGFSI